MSHGIQTEDFVANSRRALADAQLQRALSGAMAKVGESRGAAVADVGEEEWQRLRERARAVKEHAVAHLDYYLAQFADNVERGGGRVFWARDAAAANGHVTELARRRGVSLAVKSKSMITEEIGLNRALASAGVEAVETDLGEYIVQLAGERPSHINIPAVHKTRGEVADLLEAKLGAGRPAEIPEMAALVRRTLRARFAEAGLGVTGANFAVAETGTLVLVENEGNIRLTTSLPRIHVAVLSIEKVIPRMEDLEVFLPLLTRSASGQKVCSYVSLLNGLPRARGEDGPEELHVVILDNGRTTMLADPHAREALYCIRCGACLNTCPVYRKVGGHAYGWVYPGPIGSVLTPQLIGRGRAADLPFASTLCGACRDVCPLKIDIPDMLLRLRSEIKESPRESGPNEYPAALVEDEGVRARTRGTLAGRVRTRCLGLVERALFKLWAATLKNSSRYERASKLARLAQRIVAGDSPRGLRSRLLARMTGRRSLAPRLAARSFRQRWAAGAEAQAQAESQTVARRPHGGAEAEAAAE